MRKFSWLGIFFSPFKLPQIKIYVGKIKMPTPYFLPRRSRRLKKKEAMAAAISHMTAYPERCKDKVISQIYREKLSRGRKFVDIKRFGINIVDLGWKYKWDSVRHEWNPMISFILLGLQLYIEFGLKNTMSNMCYWEAWLTYKDVKRKNNGCVDEEFLVKETINKYGATWTSYDKDKNIKTNYWHDILRKKYKHLVHGERTEITTNNE